MAPLNRIDDVGVWAEFTAVGAAFFASAVLVACSMLCICGKPQRDDEGDAKKVNNVTKGAPPKSYEVPKKVEGDQQGIVGAQQGVVGATGKSNGGEAGAADVGDNVGESQMKTFTVGDPSAKFHMTIGPRSESGVSAVKAAKDGKKPSVSTKPKRTFTKGGQPSKK